MRYTTKQAMLIDVLEGCLIDEMGAYPHTPILEDIDELRQLESAKTANDLIEVGLRITGGDYESLYTTFKNAVELSWEDMTNKTDVEVPIMRFLCEYFGAIY